MEKTTRQETVQQNRIGLFLIESVYITFYIVLGLGLFTLLVSTNFATSYYWGVEIRPGSYADYWGARIYLGYYMWRNWAISLIAIASILYLLLNYIDVRGASKSQKVIKNRYLYAGLLLPSIFTFGDPGGVFYDGNVGFSLTGIISPTFYYFLSGWTGAQFRFPNIFPPLLILGFIVFVVGFLQIIGLRLYEKKRIGLRMFLLPIIGGLIFSILIIGNIFPAGFFSSAYNPDFVQAVYSFPTLTIGILIRAFGLESPKS